MKQEKGKTIVTEEIVYLTADREEEYYIAQANVTVNENMEVTDDIVIARHQGDTIEVSREKSI